MERDFLKIHKRLDDLFTNQQSIKDELNNLRSEYKQITSNIKNIFQSIRQKNGTLKKENKKLYRLLTKEINKAT